MKTALDAWLRVAAEGGAAGDCLAAAVGTAPDVWGATTVGQRFAAARIRVADEPVGLTAGLNVRALNGLGVIARVPAGRPFPEGGAVPELDRETAMRWVDAGRSVGRVTPEAVVILGGPAAPLAVAARAWGIPRVHVVTDDATHRALLALITPEVVVTSAAEGTFPCAIAEGRDWARVAAHTEAGAGVGLRIRAEDDSAELEAWLTTQAVRGRSAGPEVDGTGPQVLIGLVRS